eukprot:1873399-Amphidinium_carterae.1
MNLEADFQRASKQQTSSSWGLVFPAQQVSDSVTMCYVLATLTDSTPEGSLADAWADKLTRFLPADHKDRLVE